MIIVNIFIKVISKYIIDKIWVVDLYGSGCELNRVGQIAATFWKQQKRWDKVVKQVKSVLLYYYKKILQTSSASDLKNADNVATIWP